jgi:hypothetical protein
VNLRGLKYGLEYREDDHVVRIGAETAATADVDWVIYMRSTLCWLPPYQRELLSEGRQQQVRERVVESLKFLKIKYYLPE